MAPEKERSRSYPVVDLEAARELLRQLDALGSGEVDREGLAKLLGYATGSGGVAARKVGALVQYGLLDRHAGFFRLSLLGNRLRQARESSPEFGSAILGALKKPPLFRWILDRYTRVGQIPENLDEILAGEYGITARASEEAANVFIRSARFARVLDSQGHLLEAGRSSDAGAKQPVGEPPPVSPDSPDSWKGRLELPLTNRRSAWLVFPSVLTENDLDMLEKRLRFELEAGGLREYVSIDSRSAEGNVIPVGFGPHARNPKAR